jgi:hypothetical protein
MIDRRLLHPESFRRNERWPRAREFCTIVHRFAQQFGQNLIDGANGKLYLPHQIEPEALELYGSVYKAQQA